jgi:hypothetical protein
MRNEPTANASVVCADVCIAEILAPTLRGVREAAASRKGRHGVGDSPAHDHPS